METGAFGCLETGASRLDSMVLTSMMLTTLTTMEIKMASTRKPTHPGRVLKHDVIEALGLSITEAADKLGVTRKTLSELLNEHSAMSCVMAVRVGKATNTTPESWLGMQTKLDLWKATQIAYEVQELVAT
jgi:addiction module HigA family antidote